MEFFNCMCKYCYNYRYETCEYYGKEISKIIDEKKKNGDNWCNGFIHVMEI